MRKDIEQQKIYNEKFDKEASLLAQIVVASIGERSKRKHKSKKIINSVTKK